MKAASTHTPLAGTDGGHGRGFPLPEFTNLLPLRIEPQFSADIDALKVLAKQMVSRPDKISDGPDPEENLFLPAGYTYLGQFIDHDLTLDTTSTLDIANDLKSPGKAANDPSNLRSPRFDLDCVYGNGPGDQPYLYEQADAESPAGPLFKDASMLLGCHDLARGPNGRALIGDKRNDENSIVNQVQQAFIKFHNQVVRKLVKDGRAERGSALFALARNEVRWAYQTVITDDVLQRIVERDTLKGFLDDRAGDSDRSKGYKLYTPDKRANLPREFVVAAYRFGHSMVRTGYRLNGDARWGEGKGTRLPIFTKADDSETSLLGFDPLPPSHVIDDWGRFFPKDHPRPGSRLTVNVGKTAEDPEANPTLRLQFAYKIDPSLADPLGVLPPKIAQPGDVPGGTEPPSLALLNLLRGNRYLIQGGQQFEGLVGSRLDPKYLVTRERQDDDTYRFNPISEALQKDTPLWFYVLAEAQRHLVDWWLELGGEKDPKFVLTKDHLLGKVEDVDKENPALKLARGVGSQLGPVGGRIVAEVFYGLLDEDETSVVNLADADAWQPVWGDGPHTFARLLKFAGLPLNDGLPPTDDAA
jgi:hypothetical protein